MTSSKADIILRLQKEILPLQGYKPVKTHAGPGAVPSLFGNAFPGRVFPTGAVHEFVYHGNAEAAATSGFVSGILSSLMKESGVSIWISTGRMVFPPALRSFGIEPDKIIFIDIQKEKEIQWVIEEALKCDGLVAVIAEMRELGFKASRRLQLAVEKTKVTGFILRNDPQNMQTTACLTRWKISSRASHTRAGLPGLGFPTWKVELLKVRNGKPGSWEMEFAGGRLRPVSKAPIIPQRAKQKTG